MKLSNETKVGILSVAALTILVIGFNFLKGNDVFGRDKKIYMVFGDLGGLAKSNEVKINGYVIGKVYDLSVSDKNMSGIIATINLMELVNIPIDSKAFISTSLLGISNIVIEKGSSTTYLHPGDTLATRIDAGIFDDVKAQLTPTLSKAKESLDSLKMLMGNVNSILNKEAKATLQQTIANVHAITHSLKLMLDTENGPVAKSLNNVSAITENLKKNNDSITATISSAKKATEKLANLNIQPTVDSLSGTIGELKTMIAKMHSTDGTLGALMNDKQLYNKLTDAVLSAEILMDDLRSHPKRYVNFSVFGKKDKSGPLSSPTKKDSIPSGGK